MLLALLAWTQPEDRRSRLPLALVAAVLAVLAKASAMVPPALLIVLDLYPLGQRPRWLEMLPFLVLGGVRRRSPAARTAGALNSLATVPPLTEVCYARYSWITEKIWRPLTRAARRLPSPLA